jgi:cysteine desulfurase
MMAERRMVYLDNHATTMVDPRVVAAMLPFFSETFGNPATRQHEYGWCADADVEKARRQVAGLVGSLPEKVVFTSASRMFP